MKYSKIIKKNTEGWNKLIKSGKKFSNTILPEYGPFLKRNEDKINIFKDIKLKKVLDFGCGEGNSLEYLYKRGASEIWGIDISYEQIKKAKRRFPQFENNFFVSPMEKELEIPNNYFDYVISIFSIGYTSDLTNTFNNAYKYLNQHGELIISWTHPFYYCLDIVENMVVMNKSYFYEDSEIIKKGTDKIELAQQNLMISTIINEARKANFYLDMLLEEETIIKDALNGYKSHFFQKEKTKKCPTTIIFKFKKLI